MSSGWFFSHRPHQQAPGSGPASDAPSDPGAFAADRDVAPFDARRAMTYLDAVCKIGPRVSGTPGMKKQQELLQRHFEGLGGKVTFQRFTARQRSQRQPVEMANLVVTWHPERPRRALLCSHYDTRPLADEEPDRRRWQEPFISANDGGSGVALLMELGHHVKGLKADVGVDFVFFDGEEYIFDRDRDDYFFGSEHFARDYEQGRPKHRYVGAVLLDMVGGKDARFPVEQNSWFQAAGLAQQIWQIAAEQKCAAFVNEMGPAVRDDHLALNKARIPAVDVIDFSYPHWHRLSDVPANCAGESLAQVARVLSAWLLAAK
jgi:hypothetical protein